MLRVQVLALALCGASLWAGQASESPRSYEETVYVSTGAAGAYHYHRKSCPLLQGGGRLLTLASVGEREPCRKCNPPDAKDTAPAEAAHAQEPEPRQSAPAEIVPAAPLPPPIPTPEAPAPMRIRRGAKLFIEPSEFGMALSAAILKKHVPVVGLTDRDKADFFVQTVSNATQEKTGERIAKVLIFGAFAGSGKHFDATVTVTNRDGAIIFAHNSKKENFQSAAENIAKELKKHIEGR